MTAPVNNNYLRPVWRPATIAALIVPALAMSTAMAATNQPGKRSTVAAPGEARADTITSRQAHPYRSDTMEITLQPGRGTEVKTHLDKGAALVYEWKTSKGELLVHDFHGEPVDAADDEFESFIEDKGAAQSRGVLIAPFTGLHGWYWKNTTAAPVTLTLRASGFYRDIAKK